MDSKFWAGGESSDADSDEGEITEEIPERPIQAIRWHDSSSSSEDEAHRVVKASRERMWDSLEENIHVLKNHIKNCDIGELPKDFDNLLKIIAKSSHIIDVDGLPKVFIRALVELENFVEEQRSDKLGFKKLAKAKATALNTLRSKIRKSPENWLTLMQDCRENPQLFESSSSDEDYDEEEEEEEEEDLSSEELSDDEPDDFLGSKTKTANKFSLIASGNDENELDGNALNSDEADWEMSDDSSASSDDEKPEKSRIPERKWIKDSNLSKKKEELRISKREKPRDIAARKAKEAEKVDTTTVSKDVESLLDATDISPELITKRIQIIVEKRGRKGVDRSEQITILKRLAELAKKVGVQSYLEVLTQLVTAQFDTALGVTIQSHEMWLETFKNLETMLGILYNNPNTYILEILSFDGNAEDRPLGNLLKSSNALLTSLIERLDDELLKSLQFKDLHSEIYKIKLGHTIDMVRLHSEAFSYLQSKGDVEYLPSLALRILEHMHNKHESLAVRTWELVKKGLSLKIVKFLDKDQINPSEINRSLMKVISEEGQHRTKVRAQLLLAYNLALYDNFYEARDLLQMPNMLEMCLQLDVQTQILYNRDLVQIGFCAFRLGFIEEALSYLLDICSQSRHKELLAQVVSVSKSVEKSAEQELAEKRRLLPYHMHINQDLIEGVHNICAMLLEVPNSAKSQYTNKYPICRQFVRILELYESQGFVGPPESQREIILTATKSLQKGDWKETFKFVCQLNIWDKWIDSDKVKETLLKRIKREAMRTYIFTFQSLYDSFSVPQLSGMFMLPRSDVHSIVSKMMVSSEIQASWDENSECIVINRIEPSRLQQMCLTLADTIALAVDQNDLTFRMKDHKFVSTNERRSTYSQRDDRYAWGGRQGQQHDGDSRLLYPYSQYLRGGRGGFNFRGGRGDINPIVNRGRKDFRGKYNRGRGSAAITVAAQIFIKYQVGPSIS